MKAALAGLAMIAGAALGVNRTPLVTVTIQRLSDDEWVATVRGEGARYLKTSQAVAVARSGHDALKKLAQKWDRAGFME
jgi:hypothetical protein